MNKTAAAAHWICFKFHPGHGIACIYDNWSYLCFICCVLCSDISLSVCSSCSCFSCISRSLRASLSATAARIRSSSSSFLALSWESSLFTILFTRSCFFLSMTNRLELLAFIISTCGIVKNLSKMLRRKSGIPLLLFYLNQDSLGQDIYILSLLHFSMS